MKQYSIESIIKLMKLKGYPVFENGQYNINTVGIRSIINDESGEKVNNKFNDLLVIFYKDSSNKWVSFYYNITTIPGDDYFINPINKEFGTAILVPGFYKGVYQLGLHFNKPALQQIGSLSLYRDKNKNITIDLDSNTIQTINWAGINIHYSMDYVQNVDNWSAGCQVLAYGPNSNKYIEFLSHYRKAIEKGYKNLFSYCLLLEKELI